MFFANKIKWHSRLTWQYKTLLCYNLLSLQSTFFTSYGCPQRQISHEAIEYISPYSPAAPICHVSSILNILFKATPWDVNPLCITFILHNFQNQKYFDQSVRYVLME